MLRNVLKILLSALILIVIAALLFELGNYIVQKLMKIDSSNSYLFRRPFLEILILNVIGIGIPYLLFVTICIVLKINKFLFKMVAAILSQTLLIYVLLYQGFASDIFSDLYVLKNIFVLLSVSVMMPFIDQKIRHN